MQTLDLARIQLPARPGHFDAFERSLVRIDRQSWSV
jgi:hypothetical protein